jgi:hypothetical protein
VEASRETRGGKATSSNLVLCRLVLLGAPLVLTVLMISNPSPREDLVGESLPNEGWWLTIHTLQVVLFAFMGASIWLLTEGLRGLSVIVSRVTAVVLAIFYDVGDAVAGISTGILALNAAGLSGEEQAALWIEFGRTKHVSGQDVSYPESSPTSEARSR